MMSFIAVTYCTDDFGNVSPTAVEISCSAAGRPCDDIVSFTCCADNPTDANAVVAVVDGAASDSSALFNVVYANRAVSPAFVIVAIAPVTSWNDRPSAAAVGITFPSDPASASMVVLPDATVSISADVWV